MSKRESRQEIKVWLTEIIFQFLRQLLVVRLLGENLNLEQRQFAYVIPVFWK